ncbi:hypothetical protein WJX84_007185 [Apatococcus fuscideae]|uniref:Uncharacterized protein n=1 Tax=Apatococcus fuscideae TaxID=2026836 RepID=A0AAW1SP89_9CHLO
MEPTNIINSKYLKEHYPDQKLKDISQLMLAAHDVEEVALPGLEHLTRLDLSRNHLSRLDGLAACASLKWLNLACNQISSLGPIATLSTLQVLNAGSNQLKGTIGLASLTSLGALILPDNQLTGITGLAKIPASVKVLGRLPSLRNLCLAGCPLAAAGDYQASLVELSASITILDGKRLEGRSKSRGLERSQQSQAHPDSVPASGLGKTVSDQKTQALAGSKRARAADRQQEADAEVGDEKLPRKVPRKLWQEAPANAFGSPNGPAGDAKREEEQIAAASSDKARAKGSREPHGRAKRGEEPIFIGSRDDTHSKGAKEPRGETKKGLKERKAGAPSQPIRQPPEPHVPTHQPKRQKTAPSGNPAEATVLSVLPILVALLDIVPGNTGAQVLMRQAGTSEHGSL